MTTLSEILREKAGQPLYGIEQEATVLDAVQMMNERSIGDLNAHLTTHQEVTIHYLHEYLHGRV